MKRRSGARRGRTGGGQRRRGGPAKEGGGVEVRGEEGEVVVPEGKDRDGDEDGDAVLQQPPPPNPMFDPSPSGYKKALGKDSSVCRKAAAAPWCAQFLEHGGGPD